MASPTWWTWVWVNSRSWWWIGRPGVLQFMGLWRVGHDWVTELNWTLWETFLMLINPLLFIVNHSELSNSRVDLFWIFQLLNAQSLWIAQRHLVFGLSPRSKISFMHSPIPQLTCRRKKLLFLFHLILCSQKMWPVQVNYQFLWCLPPKCLQDLFHFLHPHLSSFTTTLVELSP